MDDKTRSAVAFAASLAVQSAGTILLCLVIGWKIDAWLDTMPWFSLLFAALGFIVTLVSIYKRLVLSGIDKNQ